MIYKAHQIIYWPRLLEAARSVDPVLANTLQQLLTQGASLVPNNQTASGMLLSSGDMDPADYDAIRTENLKPRGVKLTNVMQRALTSGHPWLQSVAKALKDVDGRAEKGEAALLKAAKAKDTKAWAEALPFLIDRHYQTSMLAQALFNAGFGQYGESMTKHHEKYCALSMDARKAGIAHGLLAPDGPPVAWPVETPDGWMWVCDVTYYEGKPWTPPDTVGHKWTEGEPLINDHELANALARAEDATALRREAG